MLADKSDLQRVQGLLDIGMNVLNKVMNEQGAEQQTLDVWPLVLISSKILDATAASPHVPAETKALCGASKAFLAPRIEALAGVNSLQLVPRSGLKRPVNESMLDVARGLSRRVPLTRLLEMDRTVRPYLAALMVAALEAAGDKLVVPDTLELQKMTS